MIISVCIGREGMEGKVFRNEDFNELRDQNVVLVVFKDVEVMINGFRNKVEMKNLVSLKLQFLVDKGK